MPFRALISSKNLCKNHLLYSNLQKNRWYSTTHNQICLFLGSLEWMFGRLRFVVSNGSPGRGGGEAKCFGLVFLWPCIEEFTLAGYSYFMLFCNFWPYYKLIQEFSRKRQIQISCSFGPLTKPLCFLKGFLPLNHHERICLVHPGSWGMGFRITQNHGFLTCRVPLRCSRGSQKSESEAYKSGLRLPQRLE